MATVAGALFTLALIASPSQGLLARALAHRRLGTRLAGQLVMLHLAPGASLPAAALKRRFGWTARRLERVMRRLERAGWVERAGDGMRLTAAGNAALEHSGGSLLAHRPNPGEPVAP
jgi:DNA-binding GntR family transcriptional regulator